MHKCMPLEHSCPGPTAEQVPKLKPKHRRLFCVALLDFAHMPIKAAGILTKSFFLSLMAVAGAGAGGGLLKAMEILFARASSRRLAS